MKLHYFDIAWLSCHDGPGKRVVLYLQQCHLRCEWCHSPHSWNSASPLLFFENRCVRCRRCVEACRQSVHEVNPQTHTLYRDRCVRCGDCIRACPSSSEEHGGGALRLPGRETEVSELFQLLLPQLELFKEIGGLTVSGGEALLQHKALRELLALCRDNGFHTAVETSGTLPLNRYKYVADLVGCWLFGLRPTHPGGDLANNAVENLEYLTSSTNRARVIIRLPVLGGGAIRPELLKRISQIMTAQNLTEIQLLPYNPDTSYYYQALGLEYSGDEHFAVTTEQVLDIKNYFENSGLTVTIV